MTDPELPAAAITPTSYFIRATILLLTILSLWHVSFQLQAAETGTSDGQPALVSRLAPTSLILDAAKAGNRLIAVGERGHILLSDDDGRSWRQASVPTRSTLTAMFFTDAKHGWAVGHDAIILHTSDAGANWNRQYHDPAYEAPLLDVWFKNSRTGYAVGAYGLFLTTTDGGESWTEKRIAPHDRHFNAISGGRDGRLYLAGESGLLYRSQDAGRNWAALNSPSKGSYFGLLVLGQNRWIAYGLRGIISLTKDGGNTWKTIRNHSRASLTGAAVLSDGRVVLVGHSGTVLISGDNGQTFSSAAQAGKATVMALVELSDNELLLFGETGIRRYSISDPRAPGTDKHGKRSKHVR